jgi:hypothetical protein
MTPYNAGYETCERTCAELRIYPGDLDPRTVSARLSLGPTTVRAAAETGRRIRPSHWALSSELHVDSMDTRNHLDWLLARLLPVRDAILELQREPSVRMTVWCVWWSKFAQGGPTLWPEQMGPLAELNLECTFDVSFYGDDDADD